MIRRPPRSTLFPYTRSSDLHRQDQLIDDWPENREHGPPVFVIADAHQCMQGPSDWWIGGLRSEEHTSELQSQSNLVCRLLLEKKNISQHLRAALQCLLLCSW